MNAALIRIALRYGAAALVAHGWLSPDDGATLATDPDIQMILGAAMGLIVEAWFWLSTKLKDNKPDPMDGIQDHS